MGGASTGGDDVQTLTDFLAPVTPQKFIDDYWSREPLHIRGHAQKFSSLFNLQVFKKAIKHQKRAGLSIRASFDSEANHKGAGAHVYIDHRRVDDYFSRGATVCVDPIDAAVPRLAEFSSAIKVALNHAGGVSVKCYYSPDKCGFNTHFDTGIATTMQISGRKRWRFSRRPAMPFPRSNALTTAAGDIRYSDRLPSSIQTWERVASVDESSFEEVVLEPGDILCLPSGVWHNAKAIGDSLALNLSFATLDFFELIELILGSVLVPKSEWRQPIPLHFEGDNGPHAIPRKQREFFQERLAELRAVIDALDPNGAELYSAWQSMVRSSAARRAVEAASGFAESAIAPAVDSGEPRMATSAQLDNSSIAYAGGVSCALQVTNLQQAIRWYRELGFTVGYVVKEFGWCEMYTPIPNVRIGLSEIPVRGVSGGAVLNFGVTDLDATRRMLEARGVKFEGPTQAIPGMAKLATFFDPDQNRLMLFQTLEA